MSVDWRGAQVPPFVSQQNLEALIDAKANILRYQIVRDANDPVASDPVKWAAWVRECLDYLDAQVLPICENKIHIVLDLHTPPGGMTGVISNLWTDPIAYDVFNAMWSEISLRYKGKTEPYVFGILNEPGGSSLQVRRLMLDVYKVIREADPFRRISITCPYSDPAKWSNVPVLTDNRVWYEFHFYKPLSFTHQGIHGQPVGKTYPTPRNNKEKMIKGLAKILAWQAAHKKRLYVGEVGVSSYADETSRVRYLDDFISLCESYGWNWTYHAWFGEAEVWWPKGKVLDVLTKYWDKNRQV